MENQENQDTNVNAKEAQEDVQETPIAHAIPQARPEKVKIIDTHYTETNNLVEWKVKFVTGKQLVLAIPGEELGFLLGFDFVFTEELIRQACEAFKGKEKFLLICSDTETVPEDITKAEGQENAVTAINEKINNYPFDRVVQSIYAGDIEGLRIKLVEEINNRLQDKEIKTQIILRNDSALAEKFYFVGVWKNFSKKDLSDDEIGDIFNTISGISHTCGLIAERPDDFESGFFSLRQMV